MTRADIVREARSWLGTAYRHKGRSRAGLDCIGLLVVVGRELDVPHEDQQNYSDYPTAERAIVSVLGRYLELAPPASPWPGSVGLFTDARLPCHCGIFSERYGAIHLIHAMLRRRVVIEEPWLDRVPGEPMRLIRRFQFPNVED